jgi:hypothetical protein
MLSKISTHRSSFRERRRVGHDIVAKLFVNLGGKVL